MAKVLILIDQMATGGAARVTSILLGCLVDSGHEVVLACDNLNAPVFYQIPDAVSIVSFEAKKQAAPVVKQAGLLISARKIIKSVRPNVLIAVTYFPFFYAYFASAGLNIPVICYDHTSFERKMGGIADWIRYHLYGKADILVVMTKKDSALINGIFPRNKVIYNPIVYPISSDNSIRKKTILCAGRLDAWDVKGFDTIIGIWGHLAHKYPDWNLVIAGDGQERSVERMKQMIEMSGVKGRVFLPGQVSDMCALYKECSVFALPSRVEGFPMVLLEAMSQGCVCVTFEVGGAVREMTGDDACFIVSDRNEEKFLAALEDAIRQFPDYSTRRKSGIAYASSFNVEKFGKSWNELLEGVLNKC